MNAEDKEIQKDPIYNIKLWKLISKSWQKSDSSSTILLASAAFSISFIVGKLVRDLVNNFITDDPEEESPSFEVSKSAPQESVKATTSPEIIPTPISRKPSLTGADSNVGRPYSEEPTPQSSSISTQPTYSVPPLSRSYRKKISFSGFASAEKISSGGIFTEEEAQIIIRLKKAGVNTGNNTRFYTKELEAKIVASATKYGVDPGLAISVARMESGGNPNAISNTGAIGIYQFTGGTANDFGLKNRFNVDDNIDAGIRLLKQRQVAPQYNKYGRSTAIASYLAHQIGPGGAREVLSLSDQTPISSLSATTQKNVRGNFGGNLQTVGEYIQANEKALRARAVPEFPIQNKKDFSSVVRYGNMAFGLN